MARILSVDYGSKRCGIAVTDPLQIIANGLTTVPTGRLITFIEEYLSKENVDVIVIGQPRTLMNEPSESGAAVEVFVNKLKKKFPALKIERIDERFTTAIAKKSMIQSGMKKKDRQDKKLLDEISATLILQSYLHSQQFKNPK